MFLDNSGFQKVLTLKPYICTVQDSFQRDVTDVISFDLDKVLQLNNDRKKDPNRRWRYPPDQRGSSTVSPESKFQSHHGFTV